MKLVQYPSIVKRPKKRIGRGHGSGKVKTAGRGTKGQNARDHMPIGFEGGQLSLTKRLPLLRGKLRNKSQKADVDEVQLSRLATLPAGEVTKEALVKLGFVSKKATRIKVIGTAKVERAYVVHVTCSKGSTKLITDAGGKVVIE
ncbi:MAG: 50S ribosomal protein L15 [Candidatus Gottesmanbacteria bacterium]